MHESPYNTCEATTGFLYCVCCGTEIFTLDCQLTNDHKQKWHVSVMQNIDGVNHTVKWRIEE
jgi:hypothetical protein